VCHFVRVCDTTRRVGDWQYEMGLTDAAIAMILDYLNRHRRLCSLPQWFGQSFYLNHTTRVRAPYRVKIKNMQNKSLLDEIARYLLIVIAKLVVVLVSLRVESAENRLRGLRGKEVRREVQSHHRLGPVWICEVKVM
jgi:hypothetical protein